MNAAVLSHFSSLGIIALCLFVPPLIGGLVAGADRIFDAKKQGMDAPSLLQPFQDFYALWRNEVVGVPRHSLGYVFLSMAFFLMALVLLGLQKNLPPILFLQAFGVLALIMGGMARPVPYFGLSVNHGLKAFLTQQPILLLVTIGIFFATGSFNFSAIKEYPRLLVIDLPLLCAALLIVEYANRSALNAGAASDPSLAVLKLANCYRAGTLLLLAGFFFAHSLAGAALAAIVLHVLLILISRAATYENWRMKMQKLQWEWGYVYFGCGLNLIWIYIKYWP
ncbi:MAG TPA: hypothetical protein VN631_04455 [Negativicutes bacterium]|nr:hypothetical protein [Negativicutes bacterium]